MHADRGRGGRPRTRILYWFRTPPGVRVGRAAIDEDAIRQIEANHPEIDFDWTQILKGRETSSDPGERRRGRERPARPAPQPRTKSTRTDQPEAIDLDADSATDAEDSTPGTIAGAPITEPEEDDPEGPPVEPATPAEARLGAPGLARLRARHAELLTRITERVPDEARQTELKTLAERLNPDAWITDADVTAGLDAYEQTYETVRSSLPPRRKPGDPV